MSGLSYTSVFLSGCAAATVFWVCVIGEVYGIGYRQGQIDALTGKVKVELVQHPDGTKTWEPKK
jgi:hypothetical protein